MLLNAVRAHGKKWRMISALIPGRTEAMCRNRFTRMEAPERTEMKGWSEPRNKCNACGQLKKGHTCTAKAGLVVNSTHTLPSFSMNSPITPWQQASQTSSDNWVSMSGGDSINSMAGGDSVMRHLLPAAAKQLAAQHEEGNAAAPDSPAVGLPGTPAPAHAFHPGMSMAMPGLVIASSTNRNDTHAWPLAGVSHLPSRSNDVSHSGWLASGTSDPVCGLLELAGAATPATAAPKGVAVAVSGTSGPSPHHSLSESVEV